MNNVSCNVRSEAECLMRLIYNVEESFFDEAFFGVGLKDHFWNRYLSFCEHYNSEHAMLSTLLTMTPENLNLITNVAIRHYQYES